jgi:hypothetical protein
MSLPYRTSLNFIARGFDAHPIGPLFASLAAGSPGLQKVIVSGPIELENFLPLLGLVNLCRLEIESQYKGGRQPEAVYTGGWKGSKSVTSQFSSSHVGSSNWWRLEGKRPASMSTR